MTKLAFALCLLALAPLLFIPAVYADVRTVETDKQEFYETGDTMTISGTSDGGVDSITIIIRDPSDDSVKVRGVGSDSSGNFEWTFEIAEGFTASGIYTVYAFSDDQPVEEAVSVSFDYSEDGNPISPSAYDTRIQLKEIEDKTVAEETNLSFIASLEDSNIGNATLTFSLSGNAPAGATISSDLGVFSWTPTEAQGPGLYTFDIKVTDGTFEDSETLTISVLEVPDKPEPKPAPEPEPEPEPEPVVPDFVDPAKGAQYYLDRYNNEPKYKEWFDMKYPDYTIQQAIELAIPDAFKEPEPVVPDFVDPAKGAQYYLDRYNNEPKYKEWFDKKYPDYTIQQAIELVIPGTFTEEESEKEILDFVDTKKDPQYYIDRYNNEPKYKEWFDKTYPDYTIEQAVGITISEKEETRGICGPGTVLKNGICEATGKGGGCLIATAAYGSEMAPQVQLLREIRDNTVLSTDSGKSFMTGFNEFYYSFSPTVADWERSNPVFREAVKITITPLLTSLSILNYVDIDSESEMLGYGISLILLNVGMYFALPAVVVIRLNKFKKRKLRD